MRSGTVYEEVVNADIAMERRVINRARVVMEVQIVSFFKLGASSQVPWFCLVDLGGGVVVEEFRTYTDFKISAQQTQVCIQEIF